MTAATIRLLKTCALCLGVLSACGAGSGGGGGGYVSTDDLGPDSAASDAASSAPTDASGDAAVDASSDAAPAPDTAATGPDPALVAIQAQVDALAVDKSVSGWRTKLKKPTQAEFTPGKTYYWLLHTDKGDLKLAFRPDVAPMHVTSTIYLTLLGFYDTLKFHRIIKGFMAQGGDPLGTGTGGPGYKYALEVSAEVKHDVAGVLSMANAGANTEGSQFFITFGPQKALDGKYSVFGNLVDGADALKAIEAVGTVGEGKPGLVTILTASVVVE